MKKSSLLTVLTLSAALSFNTVANAQSEKPWKERKFSKAEVESYFLGKAAEFTNISEYGVTNDMVLSLFQKYAGEDEQVAKHDPEENRFHQNLVSIMKAGVAIVASSQAKETLYDVRNRVIVVPFDSQTTLKDLKTGLDSFIAHKGEAFYKVEEADLARKRDKLLKSADEESELVTQEDLDNEPVAGFRIDNDSPT